MEYFYSGGGNSNPDFIYRFEVKSIPDVMWAWCESYPLNGPFERWHVQHESKMHRRDHPIVTFENSKAAYMFSIAFSEYILRDLTYSFARKYNENSLG
jgi:hypothetical protein